MIELCGFSPINREIKQDSFQVKLSIQKIPLASDPTFQLKYCVTM